MKVQKRDGSFQDFDVSKLARSLVGSGLPQEEADGIASEIEMWAQDMAKEDTIHSADIRSRVIEVLRNDYSEAAETYESYTKKPS